eukprot:3936600-Rhodomonas_salina.1
MPRRKARKGTDVTPEENAQRMMELRHERYAQARVEHFQMTAARETERQQWWERRLAFLKRQHENRSVKDEAGPAYTPKKKLPDGGMPQDETDEERDDGDESEPNFIDPRQESSSPEFLGSQGTPCCCCCDAGQDIEATKEKWVVKK